MENPRLGPGYSAKAFMMQVEQDDMKPEVWPGDFVVVEPEHGAKLGDIVFTLDQKGERPLRYYGKGQRKNKIMGKIIEVRSHAGSPRWLDQQARFLAEDAATQGAAAPAHKS